MAKNVKRYFAHDFGARNDPKLQGLLMEMGYEGLGIYWSLIELLYEQGGFIASRHLRSVAFAMHIEQAKLERVLNDFELFEWDGSSYWSSSAMKRMQEMERESGRRTESAKRAAEARWYAEECERNASAMQAQCERNASAYEDYAERNATACDMRCEQNAPAYDSDANKKINKEINKLTKESESVCDNARPHTHAPAHEGFEEKFEKFKKWVELHAPLANSFKEPLQVDHFRWLYEKYGAEKLKQCAADIHSKSAPLKNRNALNTFKKFIERL